MANQLANETSPYLLQHADNPVEWYPWGEQALTLAKQQNKPILLSIGYSACHWCHVMAHESFEDPQTAAVMNEHFINIKVEATLSAKRRAHFAGVRCRDQAQPRGMRQLIAGFK